MLRLAALVVAMLSLAAPPAAAQSGTFVRNDITITASWPGYWPAGTCVAGSYVKVDGSVTKTSTTPSAQIQFAPLSCPGVFGSKLTGSLNIVAPPTIPPLADLGKTPVTVSLTMFGDASGSLATGYTAAAFVIVDVLGTYFPSKGTCPQYSAEQ